MKVSLAILGLAVLLVAPASVFAVACPTLGSSLYDAPGSNCQLGSLVTSGPTPVISGLPQAIIQSSPGASGQDGAANSDYSAGSGLLTLSGRSPSFGGAGSPAPVFGNVVFFGPQSMVAVSNSTVPAPGGFAPLSVKPTTDLGGSTPEPASLVLLGSGLIVLGGAAFRKYRRRQIEAL